MGKIITASSVSMPRLLSSLVHVFFLLSVVPNTVPTATALSTPTTTTSTTTSTATTTTTPFTTGITRTPTPAAISANQQGLADAGKFPRTWVPLASIYELDPDRPTALEFLGQRYVTYRDNDSNWIVMDDACPHRLAPLSEGRVDRATNTLECSYHGWAFDGQTGDCQRIPQANQEVLEKVQTSKKGNAMSYSVRIEKNLLWAWLWPEDCLSVMEELRAHPEHMVAGVLPNSTTYTRDLPYGWDTLLENLVDPSHVPFVRIYHHHCICLSLLYLSSVHLSYVYLSCTCMYVDRRFNSTAMSTHA
jgi:nitrite reductase/ring-hydroxylating ferredoxin subunit